jgi:ATP-binding cassette subfamily F protein 3
MIKVINLFKAFGSQEIFEDISFNVNPGERIGLVGRNGHGKTTLLKMIIGEEHQDSGDIVIPKGYTIGHVSQHIRFTQNTVVAEACMGLPVEQREDKWKAEKILAGLGFSMDDMRRPPLDFSGGFQVRLNLARVLVSEPDMLLLDEPTNYLDIVSIRWLSSFLRQWDGEIILVTHDRSFMDSVTTHTLGIHRRRVRKLVGSTDKLYEQILKEEEIYENTRINDEKKRKEAEQFITRFRAKARLAGMVQSRVKQLEKKQTLDKLEKIKTLDFSFNYRPFNAKTLMTADSLTFSYDKEYNIINNFSLNVRSDDRICVIGKNGKGKTTLLRLLAGELKPDSGSLNMHVNTAAGYFAQANTIRLNDKLTIEEEIMSAGCEKQTARNIAGAMMFEGDDGLKKIGVLSGGEKSRVLLGKILAAPSNLLFLDEPTNHLDMESCDALLAAIDSFPGAVLMVTHNEMFLHTLANRFIVFQSDGITHFDGSYQDFLDKIGWEDEEDARRISGRDDDAKRGMPVNKKDIRKLRTDVITKRSGEIRPLEEKIRKTEELISAKESLLKQRNSDIADAAGSGKGREIEALAREVHSLRKEIDSLFDDYEKLNNELDEKKKFYETELKKLEE